MDGIAALVVNLGLATAIAIIFTCDARRRETRHANERLATDTWIREEFKRIATTTTAQLAATNSALQQTATALETNAQTQRNLQDLLRAGICPFRNPQTTEHTT